MKNILKKIIENKKLELKNRKRQYPLDKLSSEVSLLMSKQKKSNPFLTHLTNPKVGDIGIIAEIKLCSPSAGRLGEEKDVKGIVQKYVESQVYAVSIVTDEKFFCGSLDLISEVKMITTIPLLQKDFIFDQYQVLESIKFGSDALLFIAKLKKEIDLKIFELCKKIAIVSVIEIDDEKDLDFIEHAQIIGVNARNLDDFTIDVEKACRIIEKIPKNKIIIGLSGVRSQNEVEMYKDAGAKAVLVGTQLMKSINKGELISSLKGI